MVVGWADAATLSREYDATPYLTPREQKRLSSARTESAAQRFLAGRVLLRALVAELTGESMSAVVVDAHCPDCGGPHGRPRVSVPAGASNVSVGLSHTAGLVFAVAARGHSVGIDAESETDSRQVSSAIADVAGVAAGDALTHWTRVEAVLKADGRGLRVDPRTVAFEERAVGVEASVAGSDRRYCVEAATLDDGTRVSIAIEL